MMMAMMLIVGQKIGIDPQKLMNGDQSSIQKVQQTMQSMSQQDLEQVQQQAQQMLEQQTQKAQKGAKLDYIKTLKGQCPEGYELNFFKAGGKVCSKCQKKMEESKKGSPIEQFKNRNKKNTSKAELADKTKVPIKKNFVSKDQDGAKVTPKVTPKINHKINPNDTIHVRQKVYSLSDGVTQYPKVNYQKLSTADKAKVDLKDGAAGRSSN